MEQSTRGRKASQVQSIRQQAASDAALPFANIFACDWVEKVVWEEVGPWRECVYTPLVTMATFLAQVISAEQCCVAAVAKLLAFLAARGKKLCSPKTDPYCKARGRLPEQVVARLARESGQRLEEQSLPNWQLAGRRIKLVDGSTVSMPDTAANQNAYPQSRSQKPGVGFPLARIVALLSFSSGALLDLAIGPYKGKETGEPALFRRLWESLKQGDVAVGDCCFGSFWTFALLLARGVDSVFPLHQMRDSDFRRGRRLGKEDHVVTWRKPKQRPDWMEQRTYNALPEELQLREVRIRILQPGFRAESMVVVTTLLNGDEVSAVALAEIYRIRWHVELDLRSIKATMQMDVLRCKTPEMVRKEIWAHLLAYNLIRTVMVAAAVQAGLLPRQLSFAGALQTLNAFGVALQLASPADVPCLWHTMLKAIASHRVGDRPGRVEPRAVKRRPKPHRLLTIPRQEARRRLLQGTYG